MRKAARDFGSLLVALPGESRRIYLPKARRTKLHRRMMFFSLDPVDLFKACVRDKCPMLCIVERDLEEVAG